MKGPKANDIESFLSSWFFVLGNFNDLPADDVLAAMLCSTASSST